MVPPEACNVIEYATPTVPPGNVAGVVTAKPTTTEIVNSRLAVPPTESVTVMLNENVPVAVGVPLIKPAGERVSPAGSGAVVGLVSVQV